MVVFILAVAAFVVNLIDMGFGEAIAEALCAVAEFIDDLCDLPESGVVSALGALVALGGGITLYLMQDDNDEAFDDWGPDGVQSSSSCADAEDLLIVQISTLTLPRWTAIFCMHQQHPSTSSGIVPTSYPTITSCSESKFSGGDVGTFTNTYDPSIVGAN
jgi:hypothetical protein